jgi:hypothetical protein
MSDIISLHYTYEYQNMMILSLFYILVRCCVKSYTMVSTKANSAEVGIFVHGNDFNYAEFLRMPPIVPVENL